MNYAEFMRPFDAQDKAKRRPRSVTLFNVELAGYACFISAFSTSPDGLAHKLIF
jgi:hypothetical protein